MIAQKRLSQGPVFTSGPTLEATFFSQGLITCPDHNFRFHRRHGFITTAFPGRKHPPPRQIFLRDPRHVSAAQRKYSDSIWIVIRCLSLAFCPIMVHFPMCMLSSLDGTNLSTQFSMGDAIPSAFPWRSLSFGLVLLGETGTLYTLSIDLTCH